MLAGGPATMFEFDTGAEGGVLPSDIDGTSSSRRIPQLFATFEIIPRES